MIRILKFEDNVKNQSKCYNLSAKCQVHQNAEIWVKREDRSICQIWVKGGGINKTLKFEDKVRNQSKCRNLSANHQIVQNVVFWVKSGESIKKLTFECNKVEIDQSVEIWAKKGDRSNVDILL